MLRSEIHILEDMCSMYHEANHKPLCTSVNGNQLYTTYTDRHASTTNNANIGLHPTHEQFVIGKRFWNTPSRRKAHYWL